MLASSPDPVALSSVRSSLLVSVLVNGGKHPVLNGHDAALAVHVRVLQANVGLEKTTVFPVTETNFSVCVVLPAFAAAMLGRDDIMSVSTGP